MGDMTHLDCLDGTIAWSGSNCILYISYAKKKNRLSFISNSNLFLFLEEDKEALTSQITKHYVFSAEVEQTYL